MKRLITRASLQNTPILNINEIYDRSANHIDGLKFFKVTKSEVESHINSFDLENRYSQKCNGIRSHSFIPKDGALEIRSFCR